MNDKATFLFFAVDGVRQGSIDQARSLRWEAGLAMAKGLTEAEAIAAITTVPAQLYNLQDQVGRIAVGRRGTLPWIDRWDQGSGPRIAKLCT